MSLLPGVDLVLVSFGRRSLFHTTLGLHASEERVLVLGCALGSLCCGASWCPFRLRKGGAMAQRQAEAHSGSTYAVRA